MIRATLRLGVAIVVAITAWWVGPLLALGIYRPLAPEWMREILVVGGMTWGLWPLLARLWARLAMTPRQVRVPRPAQRDEVAVWLEDLDHRLRAHWLRKNPPRWQRWLGVVSHSYRHTLPCYVVLGVEAAETSTFVQQAITFSDPTEDSVGIFGSGDDHGIYLSRDSVWLDLGDGLSERADTSAMEGWHKRLRGLRRLCGGAALKGVVFCVDGPAILDNRSEASQRGAAAARRWLVQVVQDFGQPICVYVALDNVDRLDGARMTLSLVEDARWTEGIGFSLADLPDEKSTALVAGWQTAFEQGLRRVQQQVLRAAPHAVDVSINHAQLRFVETLAQLQQSLLAWLRATIAPDGQGRAYLRGVWLGAIRPARSQVDRMDAAGVLHAPWDMLWMPLFQQICWERDLARPRGAVSWRHRSETTLRWAVFPTVAIALLIWFGWGYWAERTDLGGLDARFVEAKRLAQVEASYTADGGVPLLDIAGQMRYAQAQAKGAERGLSTPYIEHALIARAAQQAYHRQLQKMLMPELYNEVRRVLIAQTNGAPGDLYQTLKVYLMLARPARRDAVEIQRWLDSRWDTLSGGQYSDEDRQALLAHVRQLVGLPGLPGTPEDAELVRSARERAAQIPVVTRVLQAIRVEGLPAQVKDVSLSRAAGFGAAVSLRSRHDIPATDTMVSGWYTRAGYLDVFLPRLNQRARATLEEQSWVLRDETLQANSFQIDALVQQLADSTRAQFLEDYVAAWQNFLNDVTVRNVTGLDDAAQLSAAMMDSQSPLCALIRFVARETTLTGANDEGNIDSWIDQQKYRLEKGRREIVGELSGQHYRVVMLPEHVVEDHFDVIRTLAAQLNSADTAASNPIARLFEPLYRQLGLVSGALQAGQVLPPQYDAFAQLKALAARQPEPVRGIMLDLIASGSAMSTRESGALLSRGAAGAPSIVCATGFTSHYPLRRTAQVDAGVEDFERMFGPQGLMAAYFRDHLAAYVDTSTHPWKASRSNGGPERMVSQSVLGAYETADRIRQVALDDAGHLRISTVLQFVDMDPQIAEAQLSVGTQTLRFAHGSASPQRIDWTAQSAKQSIQLQLKAVDGRLSVLQFNGPWALLKFFDAGQTAGAGAADRRERLYQTDLGSVRLEWEALTTPSPIWSGLLQSFRCPS